MSEYKLVERFDIETLDISAQVAFCMGVEFSMFRNRIERGERFTDFCIEDNVVRIAAMAERHGRFVEHRPSGTKGWASITIGGVK